MGSTAEQNILINTTVDNAYSVYQYILLKSLFHFSPSSFSALTSFFLRKQNFNYYVKSNLRLFMLIKSPMQLIAVSKEEPP